MVQVLGPFHPQKRPVLSLQLLASARPSLDYCRHLGSTDGSAFARSLALSLSFSPSPSLLPSLSLSFLTLPVSLPFKQI